jgi:MFS transporter, putative metabolite:H+ symporter
LIFSYCFARVTEIAKDIKTWSEQIMSQKLDKTIVLTVIVAALGYFVDIYDLLLFSIVRVASLKEIGVSDSDLLSQGVFLINMQMLGLLVGGLVWGVVGDVKGRLSVLFGSIFLYSTANIANAFVNSVETYAMWRFIAGIGLAGELGAGITLVAEILPKDKRGIGTTIVASVGILGAVVGGLIGDFTHWRTAYLIGGGLGFSLLALRVGVAESHMFDQIKDQAKNKGNFFLLFANQKNFLKYLRCVLIGIPIWFVMGILITFSPEIAQQMGMDQVVKAGHAVMWSYLGLSIGDLSSGLLSQFFKSRRKSVFLFLHLTALTSFFYLQLEAPSLSFFYFVCALLGFATGYWAVFVTISAEQFGTNIRSTVATTVPNFVRGSVIPLTFCFELFQKQTDLKTAALIVGAVSLALAYLSTWKMEETFHKDLNYLE